MVCKQECSVAITLCQAMLVQGTCVKLSNTKNVQVSLGEWQKAGKFSSLKKKKRHTNEDNILLLSFVLF